MDGVRGQPGLKGDAGSIGLVGMPGLKGDRGVPGVDCTKGKGVESGVKVQIMCRSKHMNIRNNIFAHASS